MRSRLLAVAVGHQRAHEGDRVLGLLGRGHQPGADGPDRLIGDDDVAQARAVELLEALLHLVAQLALGVAGLALVLGLADAEDRLQAGVERGRDLLRQRAVGLVVVLAALGVAEHDAVDVELGEHRRRDLAREGAGGRLVHVLRVDLDARAARGVDDGLQVGERHADGDVDAVCGRDAREQGLDEGLRLGDRLVHLPVAGDERRAGHLGQHLHSGKRLALDELE